jgi:tetratricopeptide (TPR) repeat protein
MGKLRESVLEFGISWAAAKRVSRPVARLPFLVFAAVLIAVAQMAAQTEGPKAAEVHDHLQKAEAYLKAKDPDSAVKEFNLVLSLDPNNAEAHANLGVIAFFRQDYLKASEDFRKALAINPSLVKTQALLGICRKRLGDPSARALLEKSFPKLTDKPLRLQVGMELASLYDQQGELGATASVMTSLVDLDPDNIDVLFMAQRVYSELADNTLNKLAVLGPGSARMQQVIAERLVNEADLRGAINHYKEALAIDPKLPGVHFELGEAILELAPADAAAEAEAQKELEVAATVDGDTAKTECEFGSIALLRSQPDQALAHYQRAYELDPNEVQAHMGLAKLFMPENPQEAAKYLRFAIQSDPLNGAAHYQLAQAYRRLQMAEMAQKEMHLFQEIKKTKDQVEDLYHQMNRHQRTRDEAPPKEVTEP